VRTVLLLDGREHVEQTLPDRRQAVGEIAGTRDERVDRPVELLGRRGQRLDVPLQVLGALGDGAAGRREPTGGGGQLGDVPLAVADRLDELLLRLDQLLNRRPEDRDVFLHVVDLTGVQLPYLDAHLPHSGEQVEQALPDRRQLAGDLGGVACQCAGGGLHRPHGPGQCLGRHVHPLSVACYRGAAVGEVLRGARQLGHALFAAVHGVRELLLRREQLPERVLTDPEQLLRVLRQAVNDGLVLGGDDQVRVHENRPQAADVVLSFRGVGGREPALHCGASDEQDDDREDREEVEQCHQVEGHPGATAEPAGPHLQEGGIGEPRLFGRGRAEQRAVSLYREVDATPSEQKREKEENISDQVDLCQYPVT
jgi:hypothetical protein